MRRRMLGRVVMGLAVAATLWLVLAAGGVLDGGAEGGAATGAGVGDPVLDLEEQIFEEMRASATLRGLPGMDHRHRGHGVVTGRIHVHAAKGDPLALPGVTVQLLGHAPCDPSDPSDPGDPGAPGAEGGPASERLKHEAVTAEDGAFTFHQVAARPGYVLLVDHPPYRRIAVRGLHVMADRTHDVGTLLLGAPTSLVGRVVDAHGRPVAGAVVQVLADGGRDASFDARRALLELESACAWLAATKATGDGRFTLSDLSPGRYVLRVAAPGYATSFKAGVLVTIDEQSSEVRVVLDPGAGFEGRVLDETGRGLADARVIAIAMPGRNLNRFDRVEARTDGTGAYRLDTLISGMSYGIEAWAEGYAPTGRYVPAVSGMRHQDWRLQPSGRIEGRVTDETTGAGVPDCLVTVLAGPIVGVSPVSATTAEDGSFVLPHVNPGPILVFAAKAPGYQARDEANAGAVRGLRVHPGRTTWVDWTLAPGGAVEGRITAHDGQPVAYASLALVDRKRRRQRWTGEITGLTEPDGTYRLGGVQEGTYDLRVTAPGHAPPADPEVTKVEMGAGLGLVAKDLRLGRGTLIEGAVAAPDGAPVRGARVWVEPVDDRTHRDVLRDLEAASGPSGTFRLAGVPEGTPVLLFAEHDGWVASAPERVDPALGSRRYLLRLRAGVSLPGRVVDDRGAAIAEARVRWGSVEGVEERRLSNSFDADEYLGSRVLRTDGDGRFTIEGLAPGRLLVKVEQEGFAAWYRRDLVVGSEDPQPALSVTMESTMTVRGRVTSAPSGAPIAGAFVYARERGPTEGAEQDPGRVQAVVSAETGPDGRYVLDRVPPGVHEIVLWFAEGHVAAANAWRDPSVRRQDVPAGARGIDFAVAPLPLPGGEPAPR